MASLPIRFSELLQVRFLPYEVPVLGRRLTVLTIVDLHGNRCMFALGNVPKCRATPLIILLTSLQPKSIGFNTCVSGTTVAWTA